MGRANSGPPALGVLVRGQQPPRGPHAGQREQRGGHAQVQGGVDPRCLRQRPVGRPSQRADAVGGVQRGQDRPAHHLLECAALHVHRDVHRPGGDAHQHQRGEQQHAARCNHRQHEHGAVHEQRDQDHRPAAQAHGHGPDQRLRRQRAHRQAQQRDPEAARAQAEVAAHAGDVRRPRGDRQPRQEEDERQRPPGIGKLRSRPSRLLAQISLRAHARSTARRAPPARRPR